MDTPKSQIADRLKQANNVLVTVSNNPSVDQLSAAIGLTLLLNKLGKHAVAVFSGNVPPTLQFLQPEKTFEKTTDSLRDFIIALDKAKADKLRYKVEDQMVKIFITPYRTSLSDKDLEFSQGDFNVEVVMALGVNEQQDLDKAITAHGRILHDATVISINREGNSTLGSVNWLDAEASSLSEMLVSLATELSAEALDSQMATAFLTGIVAETDRFSNDKTSSATMQISSQLMTAGANQQLVATQLEKPTITAPTPDSQQETGEANVSSDGELEISHNLAESDEELPEPELDQIEINEDGEIGQLNDIPTEIPQEDEQADKSAPSPTDSILSGASRGLALDPPALGGRLTANSEPESLDPGLDTLAAQVNAGPLLSHDNSTSSKPPDTIITPEEPPVLPSLDIAMPPPVAPTPEQNDAPMPSPESVSKPLEPVDSPSPLDLTPMPNTLSDLEKSVQSAHVDAAPVADELVPLQPEADTAPAPEVGVDAARDAVSQAMQDTPPALEPVQALNAQPVDLSQLTDPSDPIPTDNVPSETPLSPMPQPLPDLNATLNSKVMSDPGLPPGLVPMTPPVDNTASQVTDPTAPPPVPPPMTLLDDNAPNEQPPAGPAQIV